MLKQASAELLAMPLAGKRAKQSKTAAPGASATSKLPSAATSKPGVKATQGRSHRGGRGGHCRPNIAYLTLYTSWSSTV